MVAEPRRGTPRVSELKRETKAAAVTDTADFAAFQQQLTQEVADAVQHLGAEKTGTINSRVDMLNSINTALWHFAAKPVDSTP